MTANETLFVGMLSGTSRDGVDVALVSFAGERPQLLDSVCLPYPPKIAALLKEMIDSGQRPPRQKLAEADDLLGEFFGFSVSSLLTSAGVEATQVAAIGSHGQTVWHDPEAVHPESIQLGNPRTIAQRTGITTVADFRRADLEAGGQGAPLAPLLHRALFRPASGQRVVLNLGGIANISIVASDGSVMGFDTGPANCLLDAWVQRQCDEPFDRNGAWAAGGTVNHLLLLELMLDPYFKKPPPKSTGVEHFNLAWLLARDRIKSVDSRDVQATLAQLTASTVAAALTRFEPAELLVCGGGVHNNDLLGRLRELIPGCTVGSTDSLGLDPDGIEAVLFAWLARERLAQKAQDTRSITGAGQPVLLGEIFTPA